MLCLTCDYCSSIGPNVKLLIDRPDGMYCFREQKDRIYYVSEKILKLAEHIPPGDLICTGTCFGKFTKSNKFRLHVTALSYLAPYGQVRNYLLVRFYIRSAAELFFCLIIYISYGNIERLCVNSSRIF